MHIIVARCGCDVSEAGGAGEIGTDLRRVKWLRGSSRALVSSEEKNRLELITFAAAQRPNGTQREGHKEQQQLQAGVAHPRKQS
jgi:hypothetical protein